MSLRSPPTATLTRACPPNAQRPSTHRAPAVPLSLQTEQSVAGEARALGACGLGHWINQRISEHDCSRERRGRTPIMGRPLQGLGRNRFSEEVTSEGRFRWGDAA